MSPEFEWDEDKAAENLAIHGVAFRKATLVFTRILYRSKKLTIALTMARIATFVSG